MILFADPSVSKKLSWNAMSTLARELYQYLSLANDKLKIL